MQRIKADGTKLWPRGAKPAAHGTSWAAGAFLGTARATRLGCPFKLRSSHLYRADRVVVCFSAANHRRRCRPRGAGGGRPRRQWDWGAIRAQDWATVLDAPDDVGTDANDYHLAHGVKALAGELRRMLI